MPTCNMKTYVHTGIIECISDTNINILISDPISFIYSDY